MVSRMRFARPLLAPVLLALVTVSTSTHAGASGAEKFELTIDSCPDVTGRTRIIIRAAANALSMASIKASVKQAGGSVGRDLPIINGLAVMMPKAALTGLAKSALVEHISCDRALAGAMERTGATVGATAVRSQ